MQRIEQISNYCISSMTHFWHPNEPNWNKSYFFYCWHFDYTSTMLSPNLECCNPTLKECENDTHTLEMGTWESFGTLKNLKFDCRGQNTLIWGVLYIIGKVLNCRCRKWLAWAIWTFSETSYGQKKGRESNWQFDSRPLEVKNWPNLGVCRWSVTHHWKAFKESYKFGSNLIPIKGLNKELWTPKVPGVWIGTVSGLLLGSPGKKCHSNVHAMGKHREYYIGEGGGFPSIRAVVNHVNLGSPVACLNTESAPECELTNLLVDLMQVRITK